MAKSYSGGCQCGAVRCSLPKSRRAGNQRQQQLTFKMMHAGCLKVCSLANSCLEAARQLPAPPRAIFSRAALNRMSVAGTNVWAKPSRALAGASPPAIPFRHPSRPRLAPRRRFVMHIAQTLVGADKSSDWKATSGVSLEIQSGIVLEQN